MNPIRIGILSDTHISRSSPHFQEKVDSCFADISTIIHAGDLTEPTIMKAFNGKEIHAVHGNMCSSTSRMILPTRKTIEVGGYTIGITHRTGFSYDFEDQLADLFNHQVDCIIYGHTHHAVCHKTAGILYINPGSFMSTGRHGASGTYAILEINNGLQASIHEVAKVT